MNKNKGSNSNNADLTSCFAVKPLPLFDMDYNNVNNVCKDNKSNMSAIFSLSSPSATLQGNLIMNVPQTTSTS